MSAEPVEKMSDRLVMIKSFVEYEPDTAFQWGYLTALMEEAVEDIDEAGSDIFDEALELFKTPECITQYRNWYMRRVKTLS